MPTASKRSISLGFTGDVNAPNMNYSAADNATSPGEIDTLTLAAGANTITVPAGFKGVTILPPSGNTNLITLKGVTGDTGVPLHLTDPSSIGLDSTEATFVLTAAAEIVGLKLIWT